MKITIESVDNGYIVTVKDDGSTEFCHAYQQKEDNGLEYIRGMLSDILDLLGEGGGRYDKERIYISIRPGDKCDIGSSCCQAVVEIHAGTYTCVKCEKPCDIEVGE